MRVRPTWCICGSHVCTAGQRGHQFQRRPGRGGCRPHPPAGKPGSGPVLRTFPLAVAGLYPADSPRSISLGPCTAHRRANPADGVWVLPFCGEAYPPLGLRKVEPGVVRPAPEPVREPEAAGRTSYESEEKPLSSSRLTAWLALGALLRTFTAHDGDGCHHHEQN